MRPAIILLTIVLAATAAAQTPPTTPVPAPTPEDPEKSLTLPDPQAALTGTPANQAGPTHTPPTEPAPPASPAASDLSATPTGNAIVSLINKLAERGIIPPEEAKGMIAQAEAEASAQRAHMQAEAFAIAQIVATQTVAEQAVAGPRPGSIEASMEEMRVSYIPAPVRLQLKEDIKRELAAEGVPGPAAGGGLPSELPAWLTMIKPSGEIRVRYESDLYPPGNDASGAFPNFNAINTGPPFDVTGNQFAPQLNTDQNRTRFRLLARLGLGIDLGENFSAGLRGSTGENNSPVTANQSMGLASEGQGGNFSKYAIWLDRAWLRYDFGGGEDQFGLTAWAGRFDNPFFSTPLIFDEDLGFDGAAARVSYNLRNVFMPFLVGGAFPVFNTDLNFSSQQPRKFPSYDKYLFAIQSGAEANLTRHWNARVAAAYYYFHNIEGRLSTPYTPLTAADAGDTDNSRPAFAQKGNTYMPLRRIIPDVTNDFGAINQWQYFGLATPFRNLALTGRLNFDGFEPVRISLVGEFIRNLAFNGGDINKVAVNNRAGVRPGDPDVDNAGFGPYEGSADAWLVDFVAGHAELNKRGAWQLSFGYRWIGSDAVVDGFNDSEFGLGGTNMKGFTAAGRLALSRNVYLGLRWFGSESIAGPRYDMNILQLDLGAKF